MSTTGLIRIENAFKRGSAVSAVRYAVLGVCGAIAFSLILLSTSKYGIGISVDSAYYISAARSLTIGLGAVTFNGSPLVALAPLYPFVLAVPSLLFRSDPLDTAVLLHAVLFGVIVFQAGVLFLRHLSVGFAFFGVLLVLFSQALIETSIMAWTEPLFICLTLGFLLLSEAYLKTVRTRLLVLLALIVALACLTRYIGVCLVAVGIFLVLSSKQDGLRKTIHVALFSIIATSPIGIWAGRNYLLTGTPFGPRSPSLYSLEQNLIYTTTTFARWYFASNLESNAVPVAALAVVILASILATGYFNPRLRGALVGLLPVWAFICLYLAFLLLAATTTAIDRINTRLLAPVFVPLTLLLLFLVQFFGSHSRRRALSVFIACGIGLWVILLAGRGMQTVAFHITHGAGGYNSDLWRRSATLRYLKSAQPTPQQGLYSNAPEALYMLVNLPSRSSPAKIRSSSGSVAPLSTLERTWPKEGQATLVWLDYDRRDYLYSPQELASIADMHPVLHLEDGTIFSVRQRSP